MLERSPVLQRESCYENVDKVGISPQTKVYHNTSSNIYDSNACTTFQVLFLVSYVLTSSMKLTQTTSQHRDLNHSLIHTYTHTLQATIIAFHLSYWALICVRRCIMSGDMETRGGRRLSKGLFTARFISLKYTILYWASLLDKVGEITQ